MTPEAIEKWKAERGYDKPLLWNAEKPGIAKLTDTIFYERSVQLFAFDFGASDDGRDIGHEIRERVGPPSRSRYRCSWSALRRTSRSRC